jgi:hypothetical protein
MEKFASQNGNLGKLFPFSRGKDFPSVTAGNRPPASSDSG